FDVYRVQSVDGYERTLVFKDELGYDFGDVSDDGRWIAFSKARTTSDSNIHLWDGAHHAMVAITPHKGPASYHPAHFDPESRALYYLTNDGGEFTRVKKYEMASGAHEEVERAEWDIQSTELSHDGKYRVSTINVDGSTIVKVWEMRTGKPVDVPNLPPGQIRS